MLDRIASASERTANRSNLGHWEPSNAIIRRSRFGNGHSIEYRDQKYSQKFTQSWDVELTDDDPEVMTDVEVTWLPGLPRAGISTYSPRPGLVFHSLFAPALHLGLMEACENGRWFVSSSSTVRPSTAESRGLITKYLRPRVSRTSSHQRHHLQRLRRTIHSRPIQKALGSTSQSSDRLERRSSDALCSKLQREHAGLLVAHTTNQTAWRGKRTLGPFVQSQAKRSRLEGSS